MKRIAIATTLISLAAAGMAAAKGHDQSGTEYPGVFVGSETVAPAKTLGAALGNGKKPDAENGKSAEAGKPAD